MNADDRIADLQGRLLKLGQTVEAEARALYYALDELRAERRREREEEMRRGLRTYTEEEVGQMVGASKFTVRRWRKEYQLEHLNAGGEGGIRYTEAQALAVIDLATKNKRPLASKER